MTYMGNYSVLMFCILLKIRSSLYRNQLFVALMMHISQQLSGINAVSDKNTYFTTHLQIDDICTCTVSRVFIFPFKDLLLLYIYLCTSWY